MVFPIKLQRDGKEIDGYAGLGPMEPEETRAVSVAERTVEFVISSQAQDRHGDVVDQATLNLKHFEKSPVVLWSHIYSGTVGSDLPNIGLALETRKELDRKLPRTVSVAKFKPAELSKLADAVFRDLVAPERWLRSVSIGFTMNSREDIRYPSDPEERRKVGLNPDWGAFYTNAELLEYSVVPIGANREALRKGFLFQDAVEKGHFSAQDVEMLDQAFGKAWERMGIVERKGGLLRITEEYHDWLLGKGAKPRADEGRAQEASALAASIRDSAKKFHVEHSGGLTGAEHETILASVRQAAGKMQLSGGPGNARGLARPKASNATPPNGGYLYGEPLRDAEGSKE